MNAEGAFTAALLDASSKAFAAGAVSRVQEAGPDAAGYVATWGFNELVGDMQIRVQHLAEALACGRPELFLVDVDWLRATYAAREIPPGLLETSLRCLREELSESLPPDAAGHASSYLDAAIGRLEKPVEEATSLIEADAPHVELARAFVVAILEGRRAEAEKLVLDAFDSGIGVAELHLHVLMRAQAEIGRMWQIGEIHVAEEHLGSRIVEDLLAQLRARMPRTASTGHCVLTASVAGNLHDIGARIVADHFEMNGWRSLFLGANTPAVDLVQGVEDYAPDLVALSVGLGINLRATASAIEALRSKHPDVPVIVGGRPFAAVPELWRDVGADGCAADAADAVAVGAKLLESA